MYNESEKKEMSTCWSLIHILEIDEHLLWYPDISFFATQTIIESH